MKCADQLPHRQPTRVNAAARGPAGPGRTCPAGRKRASAAQHAQPCWKRPTKLWKPSARSAWKRWITFFESLRDRGWKKACRRAARRNCWKSCPALVRLPLRLNHEQLRQLAGRRRAMSQDALRSRSRHCLLALGVQPPGGRGRAPPGRKPGPAPTQFQGQPGLRELPDQVLQAVEDDLRSAHRAPAGRAGPDRPRPGPGAAISCGEEAWMSATAGAAAARSWPRARAWPLTARPTARPGERYNRLNYVFPGRQSDGSQQSRRRSPTMCWSTWKSAQERWCRPGADGMDSPAAERSHPCSSWTSAAAGALSRSTRAESVSRSWQTSRWQTLTPRRSRRWSAKCWASAAKRNLPPAAAARHLRLWVDYLTQVEALRVSIGLEAYAQRDPLVQYKGKASEMFQRAAGRYPHGRDQPHVHHRSRAASRPVGETSAAADEAQLRGLRACGCRAAGSPPGKKKRRRH